jgi:hypothetical protein
MTMSEPPRLRNTMFLEPDDDEVTMGNRRLTPLDTRTKEIGTDQPTPASPTALDPSYPMPTGTPRSPRGAGRSSGMPAGKPPVGAAVE